MRFFYGEILTGFDESYRNDTLQRSDKSGDERKAKRMTKGEQKWKD